jgi:RNA 2',3'-cyclic 3'-phosphodiesterase
MTRHARSARLFVAVDPPEPVAEQLQGWARAAAAQLKRRGSRHVRVLDARLLHVTVLFLGERPLGQVPELAEQLQRCVRPPVELSVGAPLWLPSRRPRALAVELHDSDGALAGMHAEVEARLQPAATAVGGEPVVQTRSRRFHPHLTVARMRDGAALRERTLAPTPPLSFTPRELVLYRSWLSPEGASYEALRRFPL